MKRMIMPAMLAGLLVGCGGDGEAELDKVLFGLNTTHKGQPALNFSLGGDKDNFVSVTLASASIDAGKVYSERRSKSAVGEVSASWQGESYVESLKHDTWSRMELSRDGEQLVITVAGRLVEPGSGDYLAFDAGPFRVAASAVK